MQGDGWLWWRAAWQRVGRRPGGERPPEQQENNGTTKQNTANNQQTSKAAPTLTCWKYAPMKVHSSAKPMSAGSARMHRCGARPGCSFFCMRRAGRMRQSEQEPGAWRGRRLETKQPGRRAGRRALASNRPQPPTGRSSPSPSPSSPAASAAGWISPPPPAPAGTAAAFCLASGWPGGGARCRYRCTRPTCRASGQPGGGR